MPQFDSLIMFLVTFSLGAVSILVGVLGMIWPRVLGLKISQILCSLLLLAVVLIQINELQWFARRTEAWGWALAFGLQFALVLSVWGLFRLLHGRPRLRQFGMATGLVVGGITALGWLLLQLEEPPMSVDRSHATAVAVSGFPDGKGTLIGQAWTDLGTPIRLWQLHEAMPWIQQEANLLESTYANRIIRVAPADSSHTCHGWTFTGGKYLISSRDVDQILVENGYQEMREPAQGDIIIYRDEAGEVMHSGIVRLTDGHGLTVVESKWDLLGRYMHAPDVQPYSQHFSYYRSARSGHLLAGLDERSTP